MSKLEYAEVKAQTQKDPTDRLLAEGILGQTARGREFLEALDREQLVEFVALMRLSLGQKESVKGEIKGYDPDKAKEKFLKATAAQAAIAGTQTEVEKLMTLMMKQMEISEKNKKEEREETAKREERAREIAEKNKKEEREEMIKNRQIEMEIAEKNSQMEIAYRQS